MPSRHNKESLEDQREQLLESMNESIPPGLMQQILQVQSSVAEVSNITVTISHSGAGNAGSQ